MSANTDAQNSDTQEPPIPKFLHNLFHWAFSHAEGSAKGTVDEAKVEANPVIQVAVQAATDAAKSVLMNHVGKVMGVEPTAQGIQNALIGVVDNAPAVPAEAKEPLKLLLGGLLAGTDFLSAPIPATVVKSAAIALDPAKTQEDEKAALSLGSQNNLAQQIVSQQYTGQGGLT